MITFINKANTPVLVCINKEKIKIESFSEQKYDNNASSVEFVVKDADETKTKFAGYILLMIMGLISMLLDMTESSYLHFNKFLSFPVKANLSNIDKDIIVEITNTRQDGYFCNINANANLATELIIDNNEIDNQYKAYQKECFAVFFIPMLFVICLCIMLLFAKEVVTYIVLAFIIAISFYAWYSNHKKNKEYIENIKNKNS